jgi:hypothetical protein
LATRQLPEVVVRVEPGQLAEAFPFVVDEILGQVAPARFQRHDLDALLRQFVRQHPAARAGADDDDHAGRRSDQT